MTEAQRWLDNHTEISSDYADLVERMRTGHKDECVIEIGGRSRIGKCQHTQTRWGELFEIRFASPGLGFSKPAEFIDFCDKNNMVYAKPDFLKDTKRMLEIAKNAAEFKAVSVPLNAVEDVDALLALMSPNESVR